MTQNDTEFMDSAMALAETLQFTKAAKRLRISQPQLTKNIQELEEIVGRRLFDRDRKTVTINDSGRAYLHRPNFPLCMRKELSKLRGRLCKRPTPLYTLDGIPTQTPFLISTLDSVQLPLYTGWLPDTEAIKGVVLNVSFPLCSEFQRSTPHGVGQSLRSSPLTYMYVIHTYSRAMLGAMIRT